MSTRDSTTTLRNRRSWLLPHGLKSLYATIARTTTNDHADISGEQSTATTPDLRRLLHPLPLPLLLFSRPKLNLLHHGKIAARIRDGIDTGSIRPSSTKTGMLDSIDVSGGTTPSLTSSTIPTMYPAGGSESGLSSKRSWSGRRWRILASGILNRTGRGCFYH